MNEKAKLQARPQVRLSAPDYVIEQIKQALVEERLNPGDRLPSESELEELYGVSRGSIRQAMKSLEMIGVVSIRPGDGTYVNAEISKNNFNPLVFALLLSKPSTKVIVEARYALERDIIELIINDEDLARTVVPLLRENLNIHRQLLAEHASVEALVDNDIAFHRILSDNCGNIVLQTVYNYVMEAFYSLMVTTTSIQSGIEDSLTIRDHGVIIRAVELRDFQTAKQAVRASAETWRDLMKEE